MKTKLDRPMTLRPSGVGALLRQRKLEEGKCEAIGCQQFVEGGGYCKSCHSRMLRQQSK
jgi:hypothetical protein